MSRNARYFTGTGSQCGCKHGVPCDTTHRMPFTVIGQFSERQTLSAKPGYSFAANVPFRPQVARSYWHWIGPIENQELTLDNAWGIFNHSIAPGVTPLEHRDARAANAVPIRVDFCKEGVHAKRRAE